MSQPTNFPSGLMTINEGDEYGWTWRWNLGGIFHPGRRSIDLILPPNCVVHRYQWWTPVDGHKDWRAPNGEHWVRAMNGFCTMTALNRSLEVVVTDDINQFTRQGLGNWTNIVNNDVWCMFVEPEVLRMEFDPTLDGDCHMTVEVLRVLENGK